jgi:hypothetical protein
MGSVKTATLLNITSKEKNRMKVSLGTQIIIPRTKKKGQKNQTKHN